MFENWKINIYKLIYKNSKLKKLVEKKCKQNIVLITNFKWGKFLISRNSFANGSDLNHPHFESVQHIEKKLLYYDVLNLILHTIKNPIRVKVKEQCIHSLGYFGIFYKMERLCSTQCNFKNFYFY